MITPFIEPRATTFLGWTGFALALSGTVIVSIGTFIHEMINEKVFKKLQESIQLAIKEDEEALEKLKRSLRCIDQEGFGSQVARTITSLAPGLQKPLIRAVEMMLPAISSFNSREICDLLQLLVPDAASAQVAKTQTGEITADAVKEMEEGVAMNKAFQFARPEILTQSGDDVALAAVNAGACSGTSTAGKVAVELSDDAAAAAAAARATTTAAVQNARLTLAMAYGLLTPSTVKCLGDTLRKSAQEMENRLH